MTDLRTRFAALALSAIGITTVAVGACSSSGSGDESDGAAGTAGAAGAAAAPSGPATCGGRKCPDLVQSAIDNGIVACCTASDECGATASYLATDECFPSTNAGSINGECAAIDTPVNTLQGCCTNDGQCGGLDPSLALGCVPNASLGEPAQTCTVGAGSGGAGGTGGGGPTSACRVEVEVPCDGPEDCSNGEVCCGTFDQGSGVYDNFECATACGGQSSFELCHSDADCTDAAFTCTRPPGMFADSLADFLFRCNDTGDGSPTTTAGPGVECGGTVCRDGERCCARMPQEPYCVADGEPCECDESDAGM